VDWEYGVVVICRYLEHGNWAGEFEANVLPVGSSIPRVEPSPAPAPPPSPSPSPLPSPPASAGKPPKLRVTVLMQGKGLNSGACLVSLPARRAQLCMQVRPPVCTKLLLFANTISVALHWPRMQHACMHCHTTAFIIACKRKCLSNASAM
jgi:hypothetical protein